MNEITTERIRQIAASYRNAKQKLTSAIEELRQLKTELAEINGDEVSYFDLFGKRDSGLRLSDLSPANLVTYRINLENGCWRLLVNQTGILSKATEDDRNKILQDIETRKLGEFTEENIARTLENLKNQEATCIRNLAREVFQYGKKSRFSEKSKRIVMPMVPSVFPATNGRCSARYCFCLITNRCRNGMTIILNSR